MKLMSSFVCFVCFLFRFVIEPASWYSTMAMPLLFVTVYYGPDVEEVTASKCRLNALSIQYFKPFYISLFPYF